MDRMLVNIKPLFTDITWGAGGTTSDLSLDLALHAHKTGHIVNMHLTCTNVVKNGDPVANIYDALHKVFDSGIRNIVALRGDPPLGQEELKSSDVGFSCALDLVRFIRKEFGQYFNISVAGYPEGHPNSINELRNEEIDTLSLEERQRCSKIDGKYYVCRNHDYVKEMDYLRKKVNAGADMIITQMFFDIEVFKTFVLNCRKWGIQCPIIPGLMCINGYTGFRKMSNLCKSRIPDFLDTQIESSKNDRDAIKGIGIEYGIDICRELIEFGANVLHFYTLNLEKVVFGITDGLGITNGLIGKVGKLEERLILSSGRSSTKVGESILTNYGLGRVLEIRNNGITVVELSKWILSCGHRPILYCGCGRLEKSQD